VRLQSSKSEVAGGEQKKQEGVISEQARSGVSEVQATKRFKSELTRYTSNAAEDTDQTLKTGWKRCVN
jgi:hypothetical protein